MISAFPNFHGIEKISLKGVRAFDRRVFPRARLRNCELWLFDRVSSVGGGSPATTFRTAVFHRFTALGMAKSSLDASDGPTKFALNATQKNHSNVLSAQNFQKIMIFNQ